MPPRERSASLLSGIQSRSTPNLPTLQSLGDHDASQRFGRTGMNAGDGQGADYNDNEDTLSEFESSEDDEEEVDEEGSPPTPRLLYTSRSHSHLPRHPLFPPFYNRPPTPLPPSPSLKSLLRPSFTKPPSTSTLISSALHAPAIPLASPKVPTYEYYGFALYVGSSAAFLVYVLWAYVPARLLQHMGVRYYPDRWWALAGPCWVVVLLVWIYVALGSWNTEVLTLGLGRVECLVDECGRVDGVGRREGRYEVHEDVDWKGIWSTGTDAVLDVPIGGVCEILYGGEEGG